MNAQPSEFFVSPGGTVSVVRFIVVTFAFLAFAFYQLSGGAEFNPTETRLSRIDLPEGVSVVNLETAPAVTEQGPAEVTRVSLDLATLEDVQPARRTQTLPARQVAAEPEALPADTERAVIEELSGSIILPSLIDNAAVVTPVDFSNDATGQSVTATGGEDLRAVTGSRVNVRSGPGTSFGVVTSLTRGDQVIILEDPGNGWVRMRPIGGGPDGWMADFLLAAG